MSRTEPTIPILDPIPKFWSRHPKHGELIPIPGHEKSAFLPIKIPLPQHINKGLIEPDKWGVPDVQELSQKLLPGSIIEHICVSRTFRPPTDEWPNVSHATIPISPNTMREDIHRFCTNIDLILGANVPTLIIISCSNGINATGIAIVSYFVTALRVSLVEALAIFKKSQDIGIFNQEFLDALCVAIDYIGEPPRATKIPLYICELDRGTSDTTLKPDILPFTSYGAAVEDNSTTLQRLNEMMPHSEGSPPFDSPVPPVTIWNENYFLTCKTQPMRVFVYPLGVRVLFIADQPNRFFIVYGGRFYRFKAEIPAERLPIIATAMLNSMPNNLMIFLTDLIQTGNEVFGLSKLDDRLDAIWALLSDLKSPHKKVQFCYRPAGRLVVAEQLVDYFEHLSFDADGLDLAPYQIKTNPGSDLIFIPHHPTVVLLVKFNSYKGCCLYALNSEKTGAVFHKFILLDRTESITDNMLVRFHMIPRKSHGNMILDYRPITFVRNGYPDLLSYVEQMCHFALDDVPMPKIAKQLSDEINEIMKLKTKKLDPKQSQ